MESLQIGSAEDVTGFRGYYFYFYCHPFLLLLVNSRRTSGNIHKPIAGLGLVSIMSRVSDSPPVQFIATSPTHSFSGPD